MPSYPSPVAILTRFEGEVSGRARFALGSIDNIHASTRPYLDPFLSLRRPPRWDLAAERFHASEALREARQRWQDRPALTTEVRADIARMLDQEGGVLTVPEAARIGPDRRHEAPMVVNFTTYPLRHGPTMPIIP